MNDQNNNQLAWSIIELLEALTDFIWENYTTDEVISNGIVVDVNIEDLDTE